VVSQVSGRSAAVVRRRTVVAGLLGLVAAAGLVVVAVRGDDQAASALPAQTGFPEPGVIHVHGLGVDPGDGVLYAATHSGLFAIPEEGPARRVANRYADIMGFAVVGPGHFVGSGHPDFREDDEPLVGFIESTDAGQSWQRLSLHGESDLHAIDVDHGRVYAYDSTNERVLASDDGGRTWDRRAEVVLEDLAVSPDDPQLLLATSADQLVRSSDAGRTWQPVPGAPAARVLDWDDEVIAVAPDGAVHASPDGETSWRLRGDVGGEPEAVLSVDGREPRLLVAVSRSGIVQSADGGRTFTVRYRDSAS
jgi:hypothetical protein